MTEWQFHPAGSQFWNGAVNIFVKKVKRSLKHGFEQADVLIGVGDKLQGGRFYPQQQT